jgi:hypothetical protein
LPLADDPARIAAIVVLGVMLVAPAAAVGFGLVRAGYPYFTPVALLAPVALLFGFDAMGQALRGSRAAWFVAVGALMSAILCVGFYPALANQLSPKEVFRSYDRVKVGEEPLAMLGVGGRTSAYYAGREPLALSGTQEAYDWLGAASAPKRRFIVSRFEDLSRLNQLYRTRFGTNVPVLDGRSSQIVLVASSLKSGEQSENPLDKIVLNEAPPMQRPLDVNMEDKLLVLGIELLDAKGQRIDAASIGKPFHLRSYYKVLQPVGTEYEAFIHIDGYHRRHNGDHKICAGKYPMGLWQKGDIIVDDYEVKLEPNFANGDYDILFGFYLGDARLKVKGPGHDGENRVNGGKLRVR